MRRITLFIFSFLLTLLLSYDGARGQDVEFTPQVVLADDSSTVGRSARIDFRWRAGDWFHPIAVYEYGDDLILGGGFRVPLPGRHGVRVVAAREFSGSGADRWRAILSGEAYVSASLAIMASAYMASASTDDARAAFGVMIR